MKTRAILTLLLLSFVVLSLWGCGPGATDPEPSDDRITVINSANQLVDRIDHTREVIAIESVAGLKSGLDDLSHTFTLVGELLPPTTNDAVEVRATYVQVVGDLAYVTYNKEDERFAGGVEVVDISNPAYPVVISQALFNDTDLAALTLNPDSSLLYLVGGRNPAESGFASPAVLERMALHQGLLTDVTTSFDVQSWVANGISLGENWLCISSGNATGAGQVGGVGAVSLTGSTMTVLDWDDFNNSQFLVADDDRIVALQIGATPMLRVYDRFNTSLNLVAAHPLRGPIGPVEGKHTLDLAGNLAWVAMGDRGVASINLIDGTITNWLGPQIPEDGNPSDYLSNGISVDDDYVYIANGAGGLYICPLPEESGELTLGGTWNFNSSANYVCVNKDMIFVASGAGGLKILTKTPDSNPLNLAMDFPRNDDSLSMGAPEILMLTDQITIETWCYLREVSDWMGILSFMTDHEGTESGYGFRYMDGEMRFSLKTVDSADISYADNPGSPVELDQWMHVAGTYDGQTARFYLNGTLISEQAITGAVDWDPVPYRFKLGKFYDSNNSHYMNGLLDEVRIWDVARSQADINQDMNHVLSGHEQGLVGYWNFDNGPGENVPDLTGNGSDGRLHGIYPANWVESGAGLLD